MNKLFCFRIQQDRNVRKQLALRLKTLISGHPIQCEEREWAAVLSNSWKSRQAALKRSENGNRGLVTYLNQEKNVQSPTGTKESKENNKEIDQLPEVEFLNRTQFRRIEAHDMRNQTFGVRSEPIQQKYSTLLGSH